jgi:hypothetical protein
VALGLTAPVAASARAASRRDVVVAAATAVAFRIVGLALDAHPRFFLGDSESYLTTRLGGWIPWDRSWVYGLVVYPVLAASRSFTALIALQALASAALAVGVAAWCRAAGVRRSLAAAALVAVSLDPMLAWYERSVMTDGPGAAAAWAGVGAALALLTTRARPIRLALASAAAFTVAIALRTAVVPLVAAAVGGVAVAAAVLELRTAGRAGAGARRVAAAVALAALTAAGAAGYAALTGALTRSPAALNPRDGYFLLGVVAPILAPVDFAGTRVADPAALLREARHADRALRNDQVFAPWGLAPRLEAALGDWREVSAVGRAAARRAVLRDPSGFAGLVLANGRDYLDREQYVGGFASQAGVDRPLSASVVEMLRGLVRGPVTAELPGTPSPAVGWLRTVMPAQPALVALALCAPLLAAAAAARRSAPLALRASGFVLSATACGYLVAVLALSPMVVPRYLLPLTPLLVAWGAVTAEILLARRSA